jgi:NOL1/NOP2/fmu family ribosome biogenesis protein
MQNESLRILHLREIRNIEDMIKENYDCEIGLRKFLVMEGSGGKIWIASGTIADVDLDKLSINSIGVEFCRLKGKRIHLSEEGAQMIGNVAKKNVLEIDKRMVENFMRGRDLDLEPGKFDDSQFVILKYGTDIVGVCMVSQNFVRNLLPRSRRLDR